MASPTLISGTGQPTPELPCSNEPILLRFQLCLIWLITLAKNPIIGIQKTYYPSMWGNILRYCTSPTVFFYLLQPLVSPALCHCGGPRFVYKATLTSQKAFILSPYHASGTGKGCDLGHFSLMTLLVNLGMPHNEILLILTLLCSLWAPLRASQELPHLPLVATKGLQVLRPFLSLPPLLYLSLGPPGPTTCKFPCLSLGAAC